MVLRVYKEQPWERWAKKVKKGLDFGPKRDCLQNHFVACL